MKYIKYLLCLSLLRLVCLTANAVEFPTLDGRLSEVRIIEIARLRPDHLKDKEPAQDGLVFVFRVDRKSGTSGDFSLVELRRFMINGSEYPQKHVSANNSKVAESNDWKVLPPGEVSPSTTTGLDEPNTVLGTWSDYLKEYRPDLIAYPNGRNDSDSVMMIVEIYGPSLPQEGNCTVTIDVGWGMETEKFTHAFRLENLKRAMTELNK